MRPALMTLALLLASTSAASADVVVSAPFTFVRVGCEVEVCAPFVHIRVPLRKTSIVQPAMPPMNQPGEPIHAPRPAEEGAVAAPAVVLTHADFARSFTPAAGNYEVDLIHPYTGCPVHVCFTLPPGCPKKVHVHRSELKFDYGHTKAEIRFKKDGRVLVEYRG